MTKLRTQLSRTQHWKLAYNGQSSVLDFDMNVVHIYNAGL